MIQIAVIEDDEPVRSTFALWLKGYDSTFVVDEFGTRPEAEKALSTSKYALITLDIQMGGELNAGVGLLHQIALHQPGCPVIVISGRPADIYRAIMYELDAWDYLTKPVDQAAFIAVIRNALRDTRNRAGAEVSEALPAGLTLDPLGSKHAIWRGQRLRLPMTAQRILNRIARGQGKPVSFSELTKVMPYAASQGAVATHIATIRAAFRDIDPEFDKIVNVPLVGYYWRT